MSLLSYTAFSVMAKRWESRPTIVHPSPKHGRRRQDTLPTSWRKTVATADVVKKKAKKEIADTKKEKEKKEKKDEQEKEKNEKKEKEVNAVLRIKCDMCVKTYASYKNLAKHCAQIHEHEPPWLQESVGDEASMVEENRLMRKAEKDAKSLQHFKNRQELETRMAYEVAQFVKKKHQIDG
jgi:hypothetical protein